MRVIFKCQQTSKADDFDSLSTQRAQQSLSQRCHDPAPRGALPDYSDVHRYVHRHVSRRVHREALRSTNERAQTCADMCAAKDADMFADIYAEACIYHPSLNALQSTLFSNLLACIPVDLNLTSKLAPHLRQMHPHILRCAELQPCT